MTRTNTCLAATRLAVIDRRVEALPDLLASLEPDVTALVLDPDRDGMVQLSEILAAQPQVRELHLIGHGRPGAIALGNRWLTGEAIAAAKGSLGLWARALARPPEILIYGCQTGAGAIGRQFVATLAETTGAIVAASSAIVGSAARGGQWLLDVTTGAIQGRSAFSSIGQATYPGSFAPCYPNIIYAVSDGQVFALKLASGIPDSQRFSTPTDAVTGADLDNRLSRPELGITFGLIQASARTLNPADRTQPGLLYFVDTNGQFGAWNPQDGSLQSFGTITTAGNNNNGVGAGTNLPIIRQLGMVLDTTTNKLRLFAGHQNGLSEIDIAAGSPTFGKVISTRLVRLQAATNVAFNAGAFNDGLTPGSVNIAATTNLSLGSGDLAFEPDQTKAAANQYMYFVSGTSLNPANTFTAFNQGRRAIYKVPLDDVINGTSDTNVTIPDPKPGAAPGATVTGKMIPKASLVVPLSPTKGIGNNGAGLGFATDGNLYVAGDKTSPSDTSVVKILDYTTSTASFAPSITTNTTINDMGSTPTLTNAVDLDVIKKIKTSVPGVVDATKVQSGSDISFSIDVKNKANCDIYGVDFQDDLNGLGLDLLSWNTSVTSGSATPSSNTVPGTPVNPIATKLNLNAGATATFQIDARIRPETSGPKTNTATATLPEGFFDPQNKSGIPSKETGSVDFTVVREADLEIKKLVPTKASVGTQFTQSIVVTNKGYSSINNVKALDTINTGNVSDISLVSVSDNGQVTPNPAPSNFFNAVVTWDIGSLASGQSVTRTITLKADKQGVYKNTAKLESTDLNNKTVTDPNTTNNEYVSDWEVGTIGGTPGHGVATTIVDGNLPELSIQKTASANRITLGESVTYFLKVSNTGQKLAENIAVVDKLDAGLVSGVTSIVGEKGFSGQVSGNQVLFTGGILGIGETATLKVVIKPSSLGTYKNTASVDPDDTIKEIDDKNNDSRDSGITLDPVTGSPTQGPPVTVEVIRSLASVAPFPTLVPASDPEPDTKDLLVRGPDGNVINDGTDQTLLWPGSSLADLTGGGSGGGGLASGGLLGSGVLGGAIGTGTSLAGLLGSGGSLAGLLGNGSALGFLSNLLGPDGTLDLGVPGLVCSFSAQPSVQVFRVQNPSSKSDLTLTGLELPIGFSTSVDVAGRVIPAGGALDLPITFTPTTPGVYRGNLVLFNNSTTGKSPYNFPIAAAYCGDLTLPTTTSGLTIGLNGDNRPCDCSISPGVIPFVLNPPAPPDLPLQTVPQPTATTQTLFGSVGSDTIIGSAVNDFVNAGAGPDLIAGQDGSDYLLGADGNDLVFGGLARSTPLGGGLDDDRVEGGKGDDYLNGGPGNDVVYGGDGNDFLNGGKDNDILLGDRGADDVYGDLGDDTLYGGVGRDRPVDDRSDRDFMQGGPGNDVVFGSEGEDTLFGGQNNDIVYAGKNNDLAFGDRGDDTLSGDLGDDTLIGGTGVEAVPDLQGRDLVFGGAGNDVLFGNESNDTLLGGLGNDLAFGGRDDDRVFGSEGDDTLLGDRGSDTIFGGVGADTPVGRSGDRDLIFGNSGPDFINGSQGDDTIFGGKQNDAVFGGKDNDLLWGDLGDDSIQGDQGNDTLIGGTDNLLTIDRDGRDVLAGGAGADVVYGNMGDDALAGDDGNDSIYGGQGNDYGWGGNDQDLLFGDLADDTLCGEAGDDTLIGGTGDINRDDRLGRDHLEGGLGKDLLFGNNGDDLLNGNEGDDTLYGGRGNDSLWGSEENDLLYGDFGDDSIAGGSGDDTLIGGTGRFNDDETGGGDQLAGGLGKDLMFGNAGADTLDGNDGDDTLLGGQGNDSIGGGAGDDLISGDLGDDTLLGGAGRDRFVIGSERGTDTVLDFVPGTDRFVLADGLLFDALRFEEIGTTGQTRIISGNRVLAIVQNVTPNRLSAANFTYDGNQPILLPNSASKSDRPKLSDDSLAGSRDRTITGTTQDDSLTGGDGNDSLFGLAGNDFLSGGPGNDWLSGDAGDDTLAGGEGSDRFVIGPSLGTETILDFQRGIDQFVISGGLPWTNLNFEPIQGTLNTRITLGSQTLAIVNNTAPDPNGPARPAFGASDFAS